MIRRKPKRQKRSQRCARKDDDDPSMSGTVRFGSKQKYPVPIILLSQHRHHCRPDLKRRRATLSCQSVKQPKRAMLHCISYYVSHGAHTTRTSIHLVYPNKISSCSSRANCVIHYNWILILDIYCVRHTHTYTHRVAPSPIGRLTLTSFYQKKKRERKN